MTKQSSPLYYKVPPARNRTRLDPHKLLPQRSRHRAHPVLASRNNDVLAQVSNPLHRRHNRGRARAEQLDKPPCFGRRDDLTHVHAALRHPELCGETLELLPPGDVIPGEGEHRITGHTRQDHAVKGRRHELRH